MASLPKVDLILREGYGFEGDSSELRVSLGDSFASVRISMGSVFE